MRASPFYAESSAGAALDLVLPRGTSATVTSVTERDEISLLYEYENSKTTKTTTFFKTNKFPVIPP